MTIGAKLIGTVAAIVVIPLVAWGGMSAIRRNIEHQFALKARQDSLEKAEVPARDTLAAAQIQYVDRWHDRVQFVDRVLTPGRTAPIPVDTAKMIKNKCDNEASACVKQQKAAEALIANLEGQIGTLKEQKEKKPARLGLSADFMWNAFESAPGARLTPTLRVAGPISLWAEGQALVRSNREITSTPNDDSKVKATLFVGTRITFR